GDGHLGLPSILAAPAVLLDRHRLLPPVPGLGRGRLGARGLGPARLGAGDGGRAARARGLALLHGRRLDAGGRERSLRRARGGVLAPPATLRLPPAGPDAAR